MYEGTPKDLLTDALIILKNEGWSNSRGRHARRHGYTADEALVVAFMRHEPEYAQFTLNDATETLALVAGCDPDSIGEWNDERLFRWPVIRAFRKAIKLESA